MATTTTLNRGTESWRDVAHALAWVARTLTEMGGYVFAYAHYHKPPRRLCLCELESAAACGCIRGKCTFPLLSAHNPQAPRGARFSSKSYPFLFRGAVLRLWVRKKGLSLGWK